MKELQKYYSIIVIAFLFVSCSSEPKFYTIQGEAQGTTYSIKYIANEEVVSKKQTDSLLLAFDMSLSTYRDD